MLLAVNLLPSRDGKRRWPGGDDEEPPEVPPDRAGVVKKVKPVSAPSVVRELQHMAESHQKRSV